MVGIERGKFLYLIARDGDTEGSLAQEPDET